MKKAALKIRFHYFESGFFFPNRNQLKAFLMRLIRKEGYRLEQIQFVFCDDAYLLYINQTHLQHDNYTDIITFQYNEPGKPIHSDIFISIPRVKENAKTFQTGFQAELHRVIFHGVLHLCGYKDKTDKDIQIIRSREDLYLNQYVSRETKTKI